MRKNLVAIAVVASAIPISWGSSPAAAGPLDCLVPNVVRGTNQGDLLTGTACADVFFGYGGNDTIVGLGGDDVVHGGHGSDTIYGGPGEDTIYGGPGEDAMYGQAGPDTFPDFDRSLDSRDYEGDVDAIITW